MLGAGDPRLERALARAQVEYPDSFRGEAFFSEALAHRIVAACDILVMPSRFEPCGLNQLYAQRYGTVPVACATGGLRDTIEDVSPFCMHGDDTSSSEEAESEREDSESGLDIEHGKEARVRRGTGWTFWPPEAPALVQAMQGAVGVYRGQPRRWRAIVDRGMRQDLGWESAAAAYARVMDSLVGVADKQAESEQTP